MISLYIIDKLHIYELEIHFTIFATKKYDYFISTSCFGKEFSINEFEKKTHIAFSAFLAMAVVSFLSKYKHRKKKKKQRQLYTIQISYCIRFTRFSV